MVGAVCTFEGKLFHRMLTITKRPNISSKPHGPDQEMEFSAYSYLRNTVEKQIELCQSVAWCINGREFLTNLQSIRRIISMLKSKIVRSRSKETIHTPMISSNFKYVNLPMTNCLTSIDRSAQSYVQAIFRLITHTYAHNTSRDCILIFTSNFWQQQQQQQQHIAHW